MASSPSVRYSSVSSNNGTGAKMSDPDYNEAFYSFPTGETNKTEKGKLWEEVDNQSDHEDETDDKKEEVPSISYFTLYRFATTKEKWYIAIALISSILAGCTSPLNTLLFAALLQGMVTYGASVLSGNPQAQGDEFMQVLIEFAIYNSVLAVALVFLSYIATMLMNVTAFNQVYRIRQEYLKAALNQDFAYFDVHQTGGIAAKMTGDLVKLEDGIGEKLATFIYYQAAIVSSVVMALIKGWKLALLCLVSFPISLALLGLAGLVSARLSKKESEALGKAGSIAEEVISALRTVYAFSGQYKEIERYETHVTDARKINVKKGMVNGLAMGTLQFCTYCTFALSIWIGYKLILHDGYTVTTMFAVFFGVLEGTAYFSIASTIMEVFGVARGAGAQIFYLIDNVPTINPLLNKGATPSSVSGNIVLKNVCFHYPSRPDVPILKGVSLNVKRGQTVALVGHSGCGKSTIVQLISRYYDVVDGNVSIDGNDVRELSVRWLRSQIGLVGQQPVLFDTTVRQNICYGREDVTDAEVEAAARQAYAHKFVMKLPKGYDTLVGESGTSLSGGQKQRIAIARALVRNPSILLLDEATSALDLTSEAKVQKALDRAQEGRTTIVIAHRLSTIRNADVIYVFKNGIITEHGNHEELIKSKGHYYDMIMLQMAPGSEQGGDGEHADKFTRTISMVSENDNEEEFEQVSEELVVPKGENTEIPFMKVLKLNSPEWRSATAASLSSFISGFSMPLLGAVLGDFVGALSNPNVEEAQAEVRWYALMFVLIGVFAGISDFVMVFFYGVAGEHMTARLRKQMFEKLLTFEIAFYDDKNHSTGALCAQLSGEAAAVQGATGQRIGSVVQAIGTFGFALVLALVYEWRVALVALTFVPIMAGVLYKEGRMVSAESFGTAKTMEASSKIAVEAVANVRTVASLGKEETFLREYSNQLLPALVVAKKSAHIRGMVFGLSRGLFNFVYAGSMYYGGIRILYYGVDFALVIKSAQVLLMGAAAAAQAFAFAPNFQKGIKAAGRVIVLLNRPTKIEDPAIPAIENFRGTGEASLQGVKFRYPTRPLVQVLNNMELEIQRGKTVALVGSSGCGKSTVIQLLQRYYDPDQGVVTQDSTPLTKLRLADSRSAIGFVQQEPILFDRTIGENIAYGDNSRKVTMDEIVDAAQQANIHKFISSLPLGYETNNGSKGTQLSGGQKQRVAIARALVRRPKMLLLDEATSALDTESEKVVQAALDAAKAGRTCVLIAHRLSTVRDADLICVVSDGRVAESGSHASLIAAKGLYYNLNKSGYT